MRWLQLGALALVMALPSLIAWLAMLLGRVLRKVLIVALTPLTALFEFVWPRV